MRNLLSSLVLILPLATTPLHGGPQPPRSEQADPQRDLLEKLTGHWVLRGTIAKAQTTHDIDARWVLNKEYVEIHEVSREQAAAGKPQYEAMVYVVWDPKVGEYACLWLDTTGVAVFPPEGVGHAKPAPDKMSFLFKDPDGGIHTTFAYDRAKDEWSWTIDNESKGTVTPFARVKLTRK
jgi:hypothetical protein